MRSMLFIDWRALGLFLLSLVVIAGSTVGVWHLRKRHILLRIASVLLSLPLCGVAALLVLFAILSNLLGCETHGKAVYSPNGKIAARIETSDEGATGGSSFVRLYTEHGLRTRTVFLGGWRSVEDGDLTWDGDAVLNIRYDHYAGYNEAGTCTGMDGVHVHCEAKPDGQYWAKSSRWRADGTQEHVDPLRQCERL